MTEGKRIESDLSEDSKIFSGKIFRKTHEKPCPHPSLFNIF